MEKGKIDRLEMIVDNLDERVANIDERLIHVEPAVKIAANNNVIVYISVAITVINLLILLLK